MITDLTAPSVAPLNPGMVSPTRRPEAAQGFGPVIGRDPRVLVLGSLPGAASIEAGEYYAWPANAFWPIMGELCDAKPQLPYAERLEVLKAAGIALWDVLHSAVRPGSLDGSIVGATERVNDIVGLIERHHSIGLVAFNGRKAQSVFQRHLAPRLTRAGLATVTLPSTSPAFASLGRERKLEYWRNALAPYLRAS